MANNLLAIKEVLLIRDGLKGGWLNHQSSKYLDVQEQGHSSTTPLQFSLSQLFQAIFPSFILSVHPHSPPNLFPSSPRPVLGTSGWTCLCESSFICSKLHSPKQLPHLYPFPSTVRYPSLTSKPFTFFFMKSSIYMLLIHV